MLAIKKIEISAKPYEKAVVKMDRFSIKRLRSEVCAGSAQSKKEFLDSIRPVIDRFAGGESPEKHVSLRKRKLMECLSLEALRSGILNHNPPAQDYLSRLFGELFLSFNSGSMEN